MSQNRTPQHIKLDKHNYVEKLLFAQFDGLSHDIIALMQDLLMA